MQTRISLTAAKSIKTSGLAKLKLYTFPQPENINFSKVSHIIQHDSVSFTLLRINTSGCENLPLPAGLRKTMGRRGKITQGPEHSTRNQNKRLCRERKRQIDQLVIHIKHFLVQTPNNAFLFDSPFLLLSQNRYCIFFPAYSRHFFPYLFLITATNFRRCYSPRLALYYLPAQVPAASSL